MKKKWSLLLGFSVLAAPVTAAAAYYNILTVPIYHECGSAAGSWWESGDSCYWKFTTYGPFATTLPTGDALAVSTFKGSPDNASPFAVSAKFEVFDWITNSVLSTQSLSLPFYSGPLTAILPFSVSSNHNIQLRTRYTGGGVLDQCGIHILTASNVVMALNPGPQQLHQVGRDAGNGAWMAAETECAQCAFSYLTYGPYNSLPAKTGHRFADFTLSWEQLAGGAPTTETTVVATISVVQSVNGRTILASRDLKRSDFSFPSYGSQVRFPVEFSTNATMGQFEYRVNWTGKGLLKHYASKVYDSDTQDCL